MAEGEAPIENMEVLNPKSNKTKPANSTVAKPLDVSKPTPNDNSKCSILLNLANLLGYAINLSSSYVFGVSGLLGKTNQQLSYQYQTLITPSSAYFGYIWGLIFLSQGFFVAAQILPVYKDHVLVRRGVGIWYFMACLMQTAWSISFAYEYMITAFVSMVGILLCLITILKRQWRVIDEHENRGIDPWLLVNNAVSVFDEEEKGKTASPPGFAYWILRFPFAVHAGWIAPATPLMLSVTLVSYNIDPQVELWVGVIGLAVLFGMSMGLLLRQDKGAPSYIFPAVVAYACAGVAWELHAPSEPILDRFQEGEISLMKNVAGFCGFMLLVTIVSRFFAILLRDHCCPRKYSDDDDDDVIYVEADDV